MQAPDLERLIQDALAELGSSADASLVAEKVRRLDIGLPCEDEFSVICAWLGKCQLLHKLDQKQIPVGSREKYQVPDILAFFSTQINKSPLLIEVKSKQTNRLVLQPEYLQKLKNYAELLKLPLLIAWKYKNIWTLFEVKHLDKQGKNKNYSISISTAMRENLLGVLAGDLAYKIGPGTSIHLKFRKDKLISEEIITDVSEQQWVMTIESVEFMDYEGSYRTDLEDQVQSLFTGWNLKEQTQDKGTHLQLSFVAGDEGLQYAHMSLVQLLHWELPENQKPHWRALLGKEQITTNIKNFSDALDAALRQKIVSHIFHVFPHSIPDFLPSMP